MHLSTLLGCLSLANALVIPGPDLEQVFLSGSNAPAPASGSQHGYGPGNGHHDDDTVYIQGQGQAHIARPSRFESVLMARRLLALASTGVASTVFPDPLPEHSWAPRDVAGQSISLPEYLADCESEDQDAEGGNPTFLALNVATTFRNTAAGSNLSLSIDWWDHLHRTKPVYPGFPLSAAGLPRVTLFGYVQEIPIPPDVDAQGHDLQKCYVQRHPDSRVWLPHRKGSPHASFWARLVVTQVYWIGGFGDLQQIGWLDVQDWKRVTKHGADGVGDGRGWKDIKLPGE